MGLLLRSFMMLLLLWLPWLSIIAAQKSMQSARVQDAIVQNYAYRAFIRPRTGVVYDGSVPSNLSGIKVSGIRLRSGSLRIRGVRSYKEFETPTGLLAYDVVNLSATNLSNLDIRASTNPLKIHFLNVKSVPDGSVAMCAWFDLNGNVNFSNEVSKNSCASSQQGHFALVVGSTGPSPAPSEPTPSPGSHKKKKNMKKIWIIVGSVLGGVLLLVLSAILLAWLRKCQQKKKMEHMEKASEVGDTFRIMSVGSAKAPAAMVTSTKPTLEAENAP